MRFENLDLHDLFIETLSHEFMNLDTWICELQIIIFFSTNSLFQKNHCRGKLVYTRSICMYAKNQHV